MKKVIKVCGLISATVFLSGCLVTSVVGGVVGTAVDVVDTVTPDIIDKFTYKRLKFLDRLQI